jgi:AcrR family transcriptional regulator
MNIEPPLPEPAPTDQSSRGQRTRMAIEKAALRLFSIRAVDAVTIDDIVREAGVAKGSFYNHFNDKAALIAQLIAAIRSTVELSVAEANDGIDDPAMRLARGISVYVRFALEHPERALIMTLIDNSQLVASSALNRGLLSDLSQGLRNARFTFTAADSAALFVSGVAHVLILGVARDAQSSVAINSAQQMTTMMLRGIGIDGLEAGQIAACAVNDIVWIPEQNRIVAE